MHRNKLVWSRALKAGTHQIVGCKAARNAVRPLLEQPAKRVSTRAEGPGLQGLGVVGCKAAFTGRKVAGLRLFSIGIGRGGVLGQAAAEVMGHAHGLNGRFVPEQNKKKNCYKKSHARIIDAEKAIKCHNHSRHRESKQSQWKHNRNSVAELAHTSV